MINLGIICPSEIALRRFLPALKKVSEINYVGVAYANISEWENATSKIIDSEKSKAEQFVTEYGGKIFNSYNDLISDQSIDAIYLPLPPALHYQWAKKALLAGKHVLVEKPFTINFDHTKELIELAQTKNLAIHENYMFAFHEQLNDLKNIIQKEIGEVRLYRISFGFPKRAANDFRYIKKLGGGALLDCGGYTIKYASMLLGENAKIIHSQLNYANDYEVDLFGSATMVGINGITAQIAFGMDNCYKCDLEVWGSTGCLQSGRVLTAPDGFIPKATLKIGNEIKDIDLSPDDSFKKSILKFYNCIENLETRLLNYKVIHKQAYLINEFIEQLDNEQ